MSTNLIIGLGNTGTNIIKALSIDPLFSKTKLYAVDSTTTNATIDDHGFTYVSIISDEAQGSGRNRERGAAMYRYHEGNGDFDEMYANAMDAKAPVLVITSAAGGTGSGSVVPLCESLIENGITPIPIIIFPNDADPIAYHLNANDLLLELGEIGVSTYSIFVNPANTADYTPINNEVIDLIKIVFGYKYIPTTLDSIDDSDLNTILSTPGRFIAFSVKETNADRMKKEVTRKLYTGYQPMWTDGEAKSCTFMKAFSLASLFADTEYEEVFYEVNSRIPNAYDEYRNIAIIEDNKLAEATVMVAGLPRHKVKEIDTTFEEATSISEGMKKSTRPNFMSRKKATITKPSTDTNESGEVKSKFKWE